MVGKSVKDKIRLLQPKYENKPERPFRHAGTEIPRTRVVREHLPAEHKYQLNELYNNVDKKRAADF